MANRNYTPVQFALEKNVVTLAARVVFNPSGVPVLDTNNSKGICAIHPESVTFTGATTNSVTSVGTVSSFAGVYPGMTVTASTGSLQATTKIANMGADLSIILDKQAILTGAANTLVADGGRYRFQFGSQENIRLDAYNKLLYTQVVWDMTTSSAVGSATAVALAPAAPQMFIVDNDVATLTLPRTLATQSTDCSLAVQFGFTTASATSNFFRAATPANGESCRVLFVFGNSTAI